LNSQSNNDEIRGTLAKALWSAFEYGLPVSPSAMANFIVKQIEVAGYTIIKSAADDS
jgi:hypothetical protein